MGPISLLRLRLGMGGGDHITNMGPIPLGIWAPRPHVTREMGPGGPISLLRLRLGMGGGDHITNMGPIPLGIWAPRPHVTREMGPGGPISLLRLRLGMGDIGPQTGIRTRDLRIPSRAAYHCTKAVSPRKELLKLEQKPDCS